MGCKNQQDANEKDLLTIHIEDYENKVIPRPAVVSSIDTIALNTCGNFMGDIKTVCISDSMVYVLDRANAVWAFKFPSGDFVKRIRNVGHGNGEYVSAWAMTLGDSLLFLMDFDTKSILAYDAVLNYKSSFRYGFPAMDFIKVKDGFLFLNLLATEKLHRIVHTNNLGEVQQSYLPFKMSLDMIYNEFFGGNRRVIIFFIKEDSTFFKNNPLFQRNLSFSPIRFQTESHQKLQKIP